MQLQFEKVSHNLLGSIQVCESSEQLGTGIGFVSQLRQQSCIKLSNLVRSSCLRIVDTSCCRSQTVVQGRIMGSNRCLKSSVACDPGTQFDINHCCDTNACTGVIWLTDNGCATSTNLIVNSVDRVGQTCDLYYGENLVEIGSAFRHWYLGWLNGAIRMLVKEPLTKKVKKGMKLDDVRALLGEEVVRHDPRKTLLDDYFLSFPDVNGVVQFDFSDRVIATRFAPHCLIRKRTNMETIRFCGSL